jgi:hypothetical protein
MASRAPPPPPPPPPPSTRGRHDIDRPRTSSQSIHHSSHNRIVRVTRASTAGTLANTSDALTTSSEKASLFGLLRSSFPLLHTSQSDLPASVHAFMADTARLTLAVSELRNLSDAAASNLLDRICRGAPVSTYANLLRMDPSAHSQARLTAPEGLRPADAVCWSALLQHLELFFTIRNVGQVCAVSSH